MKFLDWLLRFRPSVTPAVTAAPVAPVVTAVSKEELASVRDELIAAVNAARTKAEVARTEATQARLAAAKLKIEILRLKGDIESLRTSRPDDCLASIGRLDSQTVVSSRNGNVIDLRTKEFGNVVRL